MPNKNASGSNFRLGDVFSFKRAKNQFNQSSASTNNTSNFLSQNSRSQHSQELFNYSNNTNCSNSFDNIPGSNLNQNSGYQDPTPNYYNINNSQSNQSLSSLPSSQQQQSQQNIQHVNNRNQQGVSSKGSIGQNLGLERSNSIINLNQSHHNPPNSIAHDLNSNGGYREGSNTKYHANNFNTNLGVKQETSGLSDFLDVKHLLEALNSRIARLESDLKILTQNTERSNDFCSRNLDKLNSQLLNLSQIGESSSKEIIDKMNSTIDLNRESVKEEFNNLSSHLINRIGTEFKNSDICKKDLETTQTIAKYVTSTLDSLEKCSQKWQHVLDKLKKDESSKKSSEKLEKNLKSIEELKKKLKSSINEQKSNLEKNQRDLRADFKSMANDMVVDIRKTFKNMKLPTPIADPSTSQKILQNKSKRSLKTRRSDTKDQNEGYQKAVIVPPTPLLNEHTHSSIYGSNLTPKNVSNIVRRAAGEIATKVSKSNSSEVSPTGIRGFTNADGRKNSQNMICRKTSRSLSKPTPLKRQLIDYNPNISKKILHELLTGREE